MIRASANFETRGEWLPRESRRTNRDGFAPEIIRDYLESADTKLSGHSKINRLTRSVINPAQIDAPWDRITY
jgi:hypothetical protein